MPSAAFDGPAIDAAGLRKSFGSTVAVDGIDLHVEAGGVTALLGPNGAGKTTTVRMLATLLRIDSGSARVAGFDVQREGDKVRMAIGLTGQFTAVDELLTGRENIEMIGRLARLDKAVARRRAGELLERFDLADAAERRSGTYSGGMRRRLDLAASLVASPKVLFLDEPTTGLDPRSRNEVWTMIEELVAGGSTVLLTTQYLDEADQLADTIVVIDHGRVIAQGTPGDLKGDVGGERLELTFAGRAACDAAAEAVVGAHGEIESVGEDECNLTIQLSKGPLEIATLLQAVDAAGIEIEDVVVQRPTLDDVFMALTGEHVSEPDDDARRHMGAVSPLADAHDPQPRDPCGDHGLARDVRTALSLRVRRGDRGRGNDLRQLPDGWHLRADDCIRRAHNFGVAGIRPRQRRRRPLLLDADVALGDPHGTHDCRPPTQFLHDSGDGRGRRAGRLPATGQTARCSTGQSRSR